MVAPVAPNNVDTLPAARPGRDNSCTAPFADARLPLCVDLDGTLTPTDLLLESALALIKKNPLYLFLCFVWLLGGKSNLKEQIARRVTLDVDALPYNQALVSYLEQERIKGRPLYLCTAANQRFAYQVAAHFHFFDGVLASTASCNLSGRIKALTLVDRFGTQGFDYCGNEVKDVPIWQQARRAIVIGGEGIAAIARRVNQPIIFFEQERRLLRLACKEMRIYQWVKNLLIFVPLLAAHAIADDGKLGATVLAFLSFSLCASSVYLLNDMLDLDADRHHARKRNRPFASGQLPLSFGLGLMAILLAAAAALAALLPLSFIGILAAYLVLTMVYSFRLKRLILVDVFVLASLYTVRIVAGGAATGIALSSWLILFSILIFLSLAMVKRYAELDAAVGKDEAAAGRGYVCHDMEILRSLGTAAGYLAVLVLALYMNSPEVNVLYSRPQALWLLFVLLLYWISRMWVFAFHGKMDDDPIVFAFRDRTSLAVIGLCIGSVILAT
ncbi:MAG: UbiA family prenyltransferase [Burkholderiaceae bacterium]